MSLSGKTRIRMADGTNKEIKDLYIGDMISSKDYARIHIRDIIRGMEAEICHLETKNGSNLEATRDQLILTEDGVKAIGEITIGDKIIGIDGLEIISNIRIEKYNDSVYDILLEDKDKMIVCENMILKTMF